MLHEVATGFYVWNVLSWLFIFVITGAVLCLAVYLSVRTRNGRIAHVHAASESRGMQLWDLEKRLRGFRDEYVRPCLTAPHWHVVMLAVIALLLFAAVMCGGTGF